MRVRVVHIAPTDRGLRLGAGIEGFEEALRRYAVEAMSAGLLGVRASAAIARGTVVNAPTPRSITRDGNARVGSDGRVVTTRRVERGEEVTLQRVSAESDSGSDSDSDADAARYKHARRDMRRGIRYASTAPKADWYRSMLGEMYVVRALKALKKKPRAPGRQ